MPLLAPVTKRGFRFERKRHHSDSTRAQLRIPFATYATLSDAGKRLDSASCTSTCPDYSRSRMQEWIKPGACGSTAPAARILPVRARATPIEAEPAELPPLHAAAEEIPLRILYEDDDLVAIDKPAGMVVHAGAGVHSGTLVNALLHRFASLSGVGGDLRPGIVHRLDRYTSGVLLVAKNDAAHRALAAQFAGREVEKIYLALVHGERRRETRPHRKTHRARSASTAPA